MVKTFLKIDRSTLPKDGQAIRFQMPNEEWFTGYFVEGDDLFWINESKWFNVWDVMCWVNDDPKHIVEARESKPKEVCPKCNWPIAEYNDNGIFECYWCGEVEKANDCLTDDSSTTVSVGKKLKETDDE